MFDDIRFDDKEPQEWIDFFYDENGTKLRFSAKALVKDDTDFYIWEDCEIMEYSKEDNVFTVEFEDGESM